MKNGSNFHDFSQYKVFNLKKKKNTNKLDLLLGPDKDYDDSNTINPKLWTDKKNNVFIYIKLFNEHKMHMT